MKAHDPSTGHSSHAREVFHDQVVTGLGKRDLWLHKSREEVEISSSLADHARNRMLTTLLVGLSLHLGERHRSAWLRRKICEAERCVS